MQKNIAILGASKNRAKFGNKAVRAYQAKGWRVYPVNLKEKEIEDLIVYNSLAGVPKPLDRISIYLPPNVTLDIIDDIVGAKADEIFLNPGAESQTLIKRLEQTGQNVITACSILDIGENPDKYSKNMIYIASDYAGYKLKEAVKGILRKRNLAFVDLGDRKGDKKNDFTEFIPSVVRKVSKSAKSIGMLVCGTGYGMSIGANRFPGIRATLCLSPRQARHARKYDNANILVFAAWETSPQAAARIITTWMKTDFEALPRRRRRFKEIDKWPK